MSRSLVIAIGIIGSSIAAMCVAVAVTAIMLAPASPDSPTGENNSETASDSPPPDNSSTTSSILLASVQAYQQRDLNSLSSLSQQLASRGGVPQPEQDFVRSMQLALEGNAPAALEILFEVAKHPSTKPQALALAGELLFQQQDFQSAEGVLKAAIAADASNPNPHRWLAAYYYDVGAMDGALYHLSQVASLAPEDARPWRMRGLIMQDFERHAEAIEAYKEALSRRLEEHVKQEVHAELGASLLAARNPAEGLQHLALAQQTPDILALRAECNLSLGDLDNAQANLEESLQQSPTHARALQIKANVARERGDTSLAIETLEYAVEHHPYEYDLRFHLMSALSATGRLGDAEIQRNEMNRLRKLRDEFTQLHHDSMADPNSADLRFKLGQTAEQLGKFQMAMSWYKAAVALDPMFTDAATAFESLANRLPNNTNE